MQTVREIYAASILPLGDSEKLELASMILEDVTQGKEPKPNSNGSLRALFGSISMGMPTGADNEGIDQDLAREYSNIRGDKD